MNAAMRRPPATSPTPVPQQGVRRLKAVQKLLGDSSIQTTGDVNADCDVDQLAETIARVLADDSESFQSSS
jgi:hypothetical protein